MAASITVKWYRSEIVPKLQSYDLRVLVEATTDMPEEIFVMQRGVPVPGEETDVGDSFVCLADPVDLEEYPVNAPDLENEMPYFRVKDITLRFRNMEILEETMALLADDIQNLVNALKAAEVIPLYEEVTYA